MAGEILEVIEGSKATAVPTIDGADRAGSLVSDPADGSKATGFPSLSGAKLDGEIIPFVGEAWNGFVDNIGPVITFGAWRTDGQNRVVNFDVFDRFGLSQVRYRIYTTDSPNLPEFTTINLFNTTSYRGSLSVTKLIESSGVVAEVQTTDLNGNTSSSQSTIAGGQDTLPPSAPTWFIAAQAGTGVRFAWAKSTDDIGVVGYRIYEVGGAALNEGNMILDTTFIAGAAATIIGKTYVVYAYDAAGRQSQASPQLLVQFGAEEEISIDGPFATPDFVAKKILVQWRLHGSDDWAAGRIYLVDNANMILEGQTPLIYDVARDALLNPFEIALPSGLEGEVIKVHFSATRLSDNQEIHKYSLAIQVPLPSGSTPVLRGDPEPTEPLPVPGALRLMDFLPAHYQ